MTRGPIEVTRQDRIYCLKASSDYHSELCEECRFYPNCDHMTQDDMTELTIEDLETLEQEQGTAGIQAIYTEALEEGIRCAMCTNTIKSDTGCDGGCIVDAKMYNKVMTEINSRLLRKPPREGHWIDIKNKNGTVIAARCSRCGNSPKHAIKSDFCPNCGADMREGEE